METFLVENQIFVGLIVILVIGVIFAFFAMGGGSLLEDCDDDFGGWD